MREKDQKTSKKQRNGHKNSQRSSSSSLVSFNQVVAVAFAGFLFYLSIDSRLSDRSKELILFDSFKHPFMENNELFDVDKQFVDQIPGPESIATYKGDIYTGTKDGRIVRIHKSGKLTTVVGLGPDSCLGKVNVESCGRPLGVRVTSSGDLYTVDAFNGLIKVTNIDGTSGQPESKILFDMNVPVGGNRSVFLDDLVVDDQSSEDRVIYMTDASTLWDMNDVIPLIMDMDDSGRILKYSEQRGQVEVVIDKLAFPNGIELTDSRDALLIGEFTKRRVLKHYLKGPNKGKTEVLVDLPGEPDNIRRSARRDMETYWLAISAPRTRSTSLAYDFYSDKPIMRKIVITSYKIIGSIVGNIGNLFGMESVVESGHNIKTLQPFWETYHRSMIIEFKPDGEVIKCLHSSDGYIHSLSEVNDEITGTGKRIIRLGSYANDFIGVLTLHN